MPEECQENKINLESIIPNVFFVKKDIFSLFTVKLGCFKVNVLFCYVTNNTQGQLQFWQKGIG
jgi:hypothetical protein